MKKSTIIIALSIAVFYADVAWMCSGGTFHSGMLPLVLALGAMACAIFGVFGEVYEGEIMEEKEPINVVVEMLKASRTEINGLITGYEDGRIPPADLVAAAFEMGKTFMGWSDDLPDEEALELILKENKQIQEYLKKRHLRA